ncbi:MAG: hypothetical protein EXS30_11450 [Pedosphaera sp.]|nr:hypothetical protein [Pedosphaera sp.]
MNFNSTERSILAALADIFIPAGDGKPSASEADVAGEGLNAILAVRPDLANGLKQILDAASGRDAAEVVAELKSKDSASFDALGELVAGAYFVNPQVLVALGYDGQNPRPIDSTPDYLDDGLLQSVIDRGPVYRATLAKSEAG